MDSAWESMRKGSGKPLHLLGGLCALLGCGSCKWHSWGAFFRWLSEFVGCLSSGRAVLLVGAFYEQAPRTGSS